MQASGPVPTTCTSKLADNSGSSLPIGCPFAVRSSKILAPLVA